MCPILPQPGLVEGAALPGCAIAWMCSFNRSFVRISTRPGIRGRNTARGPVQTVGEWP
jgi:hypothetical protein